MVPCTRDPFAVHKLQLTSGHLRVRSHHGGVVLVAAAVPWQQRDGLDLQNMRGSWQPHSSAVARGLLTGGQDRLHVPQVRAHFPLIADSKRE